MQLRHLRSFVAVAEELHFGRAAERLFLAQSSVSAQIRRLEQDLETRLFDRTSRNVTLTEPGRVLLDRARRLLAEAETTQRDVRRATRGEVGVLDLAFVDSAAYALLPRLLRMLHEELPDVDVRLREVSVETDLDQLHDAVDLAILRDAGQVEGLTVRSRLTERLVAAVPGHHALAEHPRLHLADLDGVDLVFPHAELAPNVHDHLRQVCAAAGVTPVVAHVALQYPTILGLVAAEYGVALVPAAIARLALANVVFIPLLDDTATTTLVLASAEDRAGTLVESVVDHAEAVGRQLTSPSPGRGPEEAGAIRGSPP